jgi:hypothetical protein
MVLPARLRRNTTPPDAELQRARVIILAGVALWSAIALAVQLRYGALASVVVVGWGGSILVCLALTVGPLGLAWRRQLHDAPVDDEPPAESAPTTSPVRHHAVEPMIDVIDLREIAAVEPSVEERVRELLDNP